MPVFASYWLCCLKKLINPMPGFPTHSNLTRSTIASLEPNNQFTLRDHLEALCGEYMTYPDDYYDKPKEIAPYLCFTDDIPFHYIPHEPVAYNHWRPTDVGGKVELEILPIPENTHHRHCAVGFPFYFYEIAAALKADRIADAAKFIGALCHILQDNTLPIHLSEGMDGVDIFIFDRLVAPPTEDPLDLPIYRLGDFPPYPGPSKQQRRLFGTSVEEAGFHFYTEYCRVIAENRFHVLPLLQASYSGDSSIEAQHWLSMREATIALAADFIHTAFAISGELFDDGELKLLRLIPLADVRAVRRPRLLSRPYQFTPFIKDWSLNAKRERIPLSLMWEDGTRIEYMRGMGMGAHVEWIFDYQIPSGVFSHLRGALGLHPEMGRTGHVRLEWALDGKTLWKEEFKGSHLAKTFDLNLESGGKLTLRGNALTDQYADSNNHIVLADPVLSRSPNAPRGLIGAS